MNAALRLAARPGLVLLRIQSSRGLGLQRIASLIIRRNGYGTHGISIELSLQMFIILSRPLTPIKSWV